MQVYRSSIGHLGVIKLCKKLLCLVYYGIIANNSIITDTNKSVRSSVGLRSSSPAPLGSAASGSSVAHTPYSC